MGYAPPASRLSRRAFLATTAGALGFAAGGCTEASDARSETRDDAAGDTPDPEVAAEATEAADLDAGRDSGILESADAHDEIHETEQEVAPIPRFDPETYRDASASDFPIGVAATDPVVGGVLCSTRYAGLGPLELVVWRLDGAGPDGILVVRQTVVPAEGGFVQVEVDGLEPGLEHRYTFVVTDRKAPVGRFRAAPAAAARPVVVLGASSCAKWDFRPFDVLARAAEADLDLFLLLGDTTYADEATTLTAYRANWARNLGTSEYRALRLSTTCAATWDDHEVANNWSPETIDPARLSAARQAFFEHMAPRPDPAAPWRIWRSFRWGQTLEVFILDCRGERRPSTRATAAAEYISEAQLAWLGEALAASTAVFKLIVSSVPITRWPLLYPGEADRWEGYPAQRARVLELTRGVSGVFWLAGDFHFGAVAHLDPPGGAYAAEVEVLLGPIAHLNPGLAIVQALGSPEQFLFLSGERNFGRFTLDPTTDPPRLTVELIGTDGRVLGRQEFEV